MFQDLGALLSFLGSTDPAQADAFAAHLDATGVPPPTGLSGMMKLGGTTGADGSLTPPVPGVESPGTTQTPGEDVGLGSWMPTVSQAPAGPGIGQSLLQGAGQAGMKLAAPTPMPSAPTGVNGGVKAPEQHQINPGILQNLLALVMQKHASTPQGPNLGSLIR